MTNSDFGIEKIVATSFWRVHAVPIGRDGKVYTVKLQTDLLDDGKDKTQDQHADYSNQELAQGRFGYLSAPQIRGLVHTLRVNNDNPKYGSSIREIQKFLKAKHRERILITSTRADYMPSQEDIITHEYGLDGEHQIKANILGPDELLNETANPQGYQALFETNDSIGEINYDFKYINGNDAFAWKVNSRPKAKDTRDTRVVGLCANPIGFFVSCYRGPQYSDSALGGKVSAEGDALKI